MQKEREENKMKKRGRDNKILNNTIMLMVFQISKILFPFITLPYLTRVLSTDTYGVVTYVKTVMNYMQIFVDFGFVLSATKAIVKTRDNRQKMECTIGDTMAARLILAIIGLLIVIVLSLSLPILRENILFTILSYVVVFESIFLMDFLFRGIEKMHVITIRFILMKIISTIFTFVLIKNDRDVMLIPILDIISSTLAILLVFFEIKKLNIKIKFSKMKEILHSIKESFIYFLSNVASTSFNAFSTIIIGIYINTTDVAYWGICMQIVGSITACYNPISDGIYPEMIRTKNIDIIKKVIKIFTPIIIIGCICFYLLSDTILMILGGEQYTNAKNVLRLLIPVLFFGFYAILLGWPTLGAIGKEKETTISTIISISVHIVLLLILVCTNSFNLISIAIVRSLTEFILFGIRLFFVYKNKKLYT